MKSWVEYAVLFFDSKCILATASQCFYGVLRQISGIGFRLARQFSWLALTDNISTKPEELAF